MEGNTAVDVVVVVAYHHVPIHIGVDKSEDDCFVADERLVVAFGVVDSFFVSATVCKFPEDCRRLPVFVFFLFDCFNPALQRYNKKII